MVNLIGVFCASLMASPSGQEILREELAGCDLPNGLVSLPAQGTPKALRGYIFKFSTARLHQSPFDLSNSRPRSHSDFLEKTRKEKAGDILFANANGGTLISISERVRDLGKSLLFEASKTKLDRPAMAIGVKERSSKGEGVRGAVEGIAIGRCYLIETVEGKYAIIRVLNIDRKSRSAFIQWVYQPDGTLHFQIPKSRTDRITMTENGVGTPARKPSDTKQDLKPGAVETLKKLPRDEAIEALIKIVKDPSHSAEREYLKAVQALGSLKATEAAPVLAQNIHFEDLWTLRREELAGCFPAYSALLSLGVAGGDAALLEIAKTRLPDDLLDQIPGKQRIRLLALVACHTHGTSAAQTRLAELLKEDRAKREAAIRHAITVIQDYPNQKGPNK